MDCLTVIDLVRRLEEPPIRALLALSVGFPTPAKIEAVCQLYRASVADHLLGCERDGVVIGCIGIELIGLTEAVIHHLSVEAAQRRVGIGRWLLEQVRVRWRLTGLRAETDQEAVDFYRKCGFRVERLEEQYPGIQRFRCTLNV